MLPLEEKHRVRILTAVARRGPGLAAVRIATMTVSLAILAAVPLFGLVRIDLWRGNHLLLGAAVDGVSAAKGFVVAMACLYGLTFLTNIVVGRFFCGFGCPVGYVSRLGENVERARRHPWRQLVQHALGAGFVLAFVSAILLWWVDPRVLVEGSITARATVLAILATASAGGFLHAFRWRFLVCTKACPIGLYYRYVTSRAPVGIVFSEIPSPCIACGACEQICPVDLDPKALGRTFEVPSGDGTAVERYGDAECLRCGDCVEACEMVFRKRTGETPPLRFGLQQKEDVRTPGEAVTPGGGRTPPPGP